MVLFLLRSAGSPWNLLRCGRRWTTSSSADCACQMQLPKAFVFRQLIFGINANPHYKSFSSLRLRLGVAASRPSCGLWYVFCRSSMHRAAVDFLPLLSLPFFCFISSMLGHEAYVLRRPSDYSSWVGAAAGKSCVDKAVAVGARRAGYAKREGLRNTPGNP